MSIFNYLNSAATISLSEIIEYAKTSVPGTRINSGDAFTAQIDYYLG